MKRKKLILISAAAALIVLVGAWLLFTGGERYDVYIGGHTLSDDGSAITLHIGVAGSMGYVRSCHARANGGTLELTFYSAFGLNIGLGAQDEFTLALPKGCDTIAIKREDGRFAPCLRL